jgi:hypothetical protein
MQLIVFFLLIIFFRIKVHLDLSEINFIKNLIYYEIDIIFLGSLKDNYSYYVHLFYI